MVKTKRKPLEGAPYQGSEPEVLSHPWGGGGGVVAEISAAIKNSKDEGAMTASTSQFGLPSGLSRVTRVTRNRR